MKKKIKLRDVSLEQYEKWINQNCANRSCKKCIFRYVNCMGTNSWFNYKDMFSDKFLNQEIEIEKIDILDEVEKQYLRNVIKPFRNRVVSINKRIVNFENIENKIFHYIRIKIKSKTIIFDNEYINFPYFNNEMYKGMEDKKEYTLEELEL